MNDVAVQGSQPTPLAPIFALTFLASIGTGVIWNGVPFIAAEEFGYGQLANLCLSLFIGVVYVGAALLAGPVTGRVERRLKPRSVLGIVLAVQSVVCFAPLLVRDDWILWLIAGVTSLMSAFLWPIVESFLTSGRHGPRMRNAIGVWNLVWTTAVALSLVMMAPLLKHDARLAIVALGAANTLALITLRWFRPAPGAHAEMDVEVHVGREYPLLLRSARLLLPLSYVLNAAMMPILPHRLDQLGIDAIEFSSVGWSVSLQPLAAATWMVLRVLTMAAMWRIGTWHGRWGTLFAGAIAMTGGFGLVVIGPAAWWVLVGFACFGVGLGIVYYAALYYAMAVGRGRVEAGGSFEALIGVGYAVGPGAALMAVLVADRAQSVESAPLIVAVMWSMVALGGARAIVPYRHARRNRLRPRSSRFEM
jgi:MFS family permease